jgi:uncharacterized membrane protein
MVRLGRLRPESSWLTFLGYAVTPYIFTVLAVGELITDQLPNTPSRKSPPGFIARILMGALCGAVFGDLIQATLYGVVAGIAGAIAGTFGGYEARVRLARLVGKDLPVALLEDVIAVGGALFLVR